MSGNPTMHIACAADESYAPHCAAMLHSLLSCNDPARVVIHFLHGPRLDRAVLSGLRGLIEGLGASIDFVEIADERVTGLQKRNQVAGVMWYRIFLAERLPELERILYLDADLLVLESLRPLWETDLSGHYGAAVSNDFEPRYAHRPQALGLRQPSDYFNSGVLLMNLAAMRLDRVPERVLEVARSHPGPLMWQDQDPLNIAFNGRWHKLHPRWNCQTSLFYSTHGAALFGARDARDAVRQPAIVHFEGPEVLKPWHYLSRHPYRERYLQHRSQTPWSRFTPSGRTLKNRLLRPLPVHTLLAISDLGFRAGRALRQIFQRWRRPEIAP